MFRVILSFVLTIFLFAGILGTASVMFETTDNNNKNVTALISEKKDKRLSIKEIESVTAEDNYRFTYAGALK